MAATIKKLVKVTPKEHEGVAGFALEWSEELPSPKWLSEKDYQDLYTMQPSEYKKVMDDAKEAGLGSPE